MAISHAQCIPIVFSLNVETDGGNTPVVRFALDPQTEFHSTLSAAEMLGLGSGLKKSTFLKPCTKLTALKSDPATPKRVRFTEEVLTRERERESNYSEERSAMYLKKPVSRPIMRHPIMKRVHSTKPCVRVIVEDAVESSIKFRVRIEKDMEFQGRLIRAVAMQRRVGLHHIGRFTLETGGEVRNNDTPNTLGLEDGDTIYVHLVTV